MMKKKGIDDNEVLNSYYENREEFIVDYDPKAVEFVLLDGSVVFKLKGRK